MASIKTYYQDYKQFGIRYVWEYWALGRLLGLRYKQAAVMRYLKKFYAQLNLDTDASYAVQPNPYPDSIWVCWWQGEEQMPEIVKICYTSLKAHANGHPVRLLTKDNYREYVEMPEWVMDMFNAGIITVTHFSDLLRLTLLSKYGGFWMDATLYLTGDLPKGTPYFFTLKQDYGSEEFISANRWSGYCIGGHADNPLFSRTKNILMIFWREHDKLINYYVLDYVLDILYASNSEIRRMIDENECSNPNVLYMVTHLNKPYNAEEWNKIKKQTYIHKLNRRIQYVEESEGKDTLYKKIKNEGFKE